MRLTRRGQRVLDAFVWLALGAFTVTPFAFWLYDLHV